VRLEILDTHFVNKTLSYFFQNADNDAVSGKIPETVRVQFALTLSGIDLSPLSNKNNIPAATVIYL
jgi:hypothetical protein